MGTWWQEEGLWEKGWRASEEALARTERIIYSCEIKKNKSILKDNIFLYLFLKRGF